MEARRRRESAKSSAATVLPSTQDEEFHLRLIDLYSKQECLWNTLHEKYENKELKDQAWQAIVKDLGSHLSPALLKSRISNLRHGLNVYKLQQIEYKMCPSNAKQPEKPYYCDSFAFLDDPKPHIPIKVKEPPEDTKNRFNRRESRSYNTESIASMVKKRLAEGPKLPMAALKQRLQMSFSSLSGNPYTRSSPGASHATKLAVAAMAPILKARPGDSVSQTKFSANGDVASKLSGTLAGPQEVPSEDEELYNKHWNLRQQMSSRRQRSSATAVLNSLDRHNPKIPPMPLSLRSKPPTEAAKDII